jgi:hypothetical protein
VRRVRRKNERWQTTISNPSPSRRSARPKPRAGRCTHVATKYRDGQTLFAVGERDFKFFIIKSREVKIVDRLGDTAKTITVIVS